VSDHRVRHTSIWRREVLAPAGVLFAIMTAHALLETARDALFLARLGAERLAWASPSPPSAGGRVSSIRDAS
jgi:hypothetical protein